MTHAFLWHGGNLNQARCIFGDGPEPWLDLSTGINPISWTGGDDIAPDWRALPEPADLAILERTAAAYFGVAPELCCAVPGTEMALRLLPTMLGGDGAHIAPTYRTHAELFPHGRCASDFDATDFLPKVLLLANPNNPDGQAYSTIRLQQWLRNRGDSGSGNWLIIDEAYADAMPHNSLASLVNEKRNLVIMRSFGKFFGLAGVRLGFVLGPPPIIEGFRRLLGEWPMSGAALSFGAKAYADDEWIAATRIALAQRAERLDDILRAHGYDPIGGCPLFRLIDIDDAQGLFDHLARAAILTRPFDYNPRWLRLGVPGEAAEFDRLDKALAAA